MRVSCAAIRLHVYDESFSHPETRLAQVFRTRHSTGNGLNDTKRLPLLTCEFVEPNVVATNFVEMCAVAGVRALAQRIDDTRKCVAQQDAVQPAQVTVDADDAVADQSTPDQ